MAVYTNINKKELVKFLENYDLGTFKNFSKIIEGVENSNFLVETSKSKFILTIYEKRVQFEDLPFFINLMKYLFSNNIKCPLPIQDNKGKVLQTISNKPSAIFSFLSGKSKTKITSNDCFLLGKNLGIIHKKSLNFNQRRTNSVGASYWEKLFKSIDRDEIIKKYNFFDDLEIILSNILNKWPNQLRKGIIHGDLFPNNVFFQNKNINGIIDFYFSCYDILAYDIAICINSWCFDKDVKFNFNKFNSLLEGYVSSNRLTLEEKKNLSLLCSGAAIRILLTRLYDSINTPNNSYVVPHDPNEYWNILNFHLNSNKVLDSF